MCCKDKSFLRYKLGHLFDLMDYDKNGTFEKKDFTDWYGKGLDNMEALGYEVTEKHRKKVERRSGSAYNILTLNGWAGKNKKRFVGFCSVVSQMPGFKLTAKHVFKIAFKLCDFDDSGYWSLEEFINLYCLPLGITEEEAKEIFKMLDEDGNGKLDLDEFLEGTTHYLSDLKENKWAHMHGRLDYDPDKWAE